MSKEMGVEMVGVKSRGVPLPNEAFPLQQRGVYVAIALLLLFLHCFYYTPYYALVNKFRSEQLNDI